MFDITEESRTIDPSLSDPAIWQWWIHTNGRTIFLQVWYLAVGWGLQELAPARSGEQTAFLCSQQPAQPWHVEVMWLAWNQPWWEYVIIEISTCFKSGLFYFRVPVYLLATVKEHPVIRPESGPKFILFFLIYPQTLPIIIGSLLNLKQIIFKLGFEFLKKNIFSFTVIKVT